jgi:hypothetical protein
VERSFTAARAGVLAAAALAGGAAPGVAADEPLAPPIGWQEPSPVDRLFLQPAFEAPEPLPAGHVGAELRVLYSNSLLLAQRPGLELVADVETAQLAPQLSVGLGGDLELRAGLPLVADWDGLLDGPIRSVEGLFHAANPDRRHRPQDTAEWTLLRDGQGASRTGAGEGLGDAWLGAKALLLEGGGEVPSLAARLALSLPTGRLPWGAGAWVPSAGLLAGWRWRPLALRLSADLSVPTAPLRDVGLSTRPYGTANVGVTIPAGRRLSLQVQASAHGSPLRGTGLAQLDHPTAYVLAGVTWRLAPDALLDFAMVENLFSPYRGADFTFVAGVRSR